MAVALAFTSCKSSESAYRKAYEKAKAQETNTVIEQPTNTGTETTVVAPVVTRPSTETTVVDNVDNAVVRQESVQLINGSGLRNFSVVVGSFSVKANAEGLQQTLRNAGYDAQIVFNSARNMYLPTTIRPVPCAAATTSRPVSIPMLGCSITSSKPKCREYFQ